MKCEKCGKETEYLLICDDCYACDDCGGLENLIYYREGLLCKSCHKKRVEKRMSKFNKNTNYTSVLTCPYCGYLYDSEDYSDYSGILVCVDCNNSFEYEKHIIVEYSTYKVKGE